MGPYSGPPHMGGYEQPPKWIAVMRDGLAWPVPASNCPEHVKPARRLFLADVVLLDCGAFVSSLCLGHWPESACDGVRCRWRLPSETHWKLLCPVSMG